MSMFGVIRHPVFPPVLLYRHRFINNIPNLQFIILKYVNKAVISNSMDLSLH